jgi:hypothetical protein
MSPSRSRSRNTYFSNMFSVVQENEQPIHIPDPLSPPKKTNTHRTHRTHRTQHLRRISKSPFTQDSRKPHQRHWYRGSDTPHSSLSGCCELNCSTWKLVRIGCCVCDVCIYVYVCIYIHTYLYIRIEHALMIPSGTSCNWQQLSATVWIWVYRSQFEFLRSCLLYTSEYIIVIDLIITSKFLSKFTWQPAQKIQERKCMYDVSWVQNLSQWIKSVGAKNLRKSRLEPTKHTYTWSHCPHEFTMHIICVRIHIRVFMSVRMYAVFMKQKVVVSCIYIYTYIYIYIHIYTYVCIHTHTISYTHKCVLHTYINYSSSTYIHTCIHQAFTTLTWGNADRNA